MGSVMDLENSVAIAQALAKIRGFVVPKGLNSSPELIVRTAKEARLRLAEYNYENIKAKLNKGKKVTEDELRQCMSDVNKAGLSIFQGVTNG